MGAATTANARMGPREKALRAVFAEFDLNDNGAIETWELLLLGKARRRLGQKPGYWTEDMNKACIDRMDTDLSGTVEITEFVKYFSESLSKDPDEFMATMDDFMKVARDSRGDRQERKEKERKEKKFPPT